MQSVTEHSDTQKSDFVLVERARPGVALVTLNRPERMNSMAFDVMVPLKKVLEELTHDNSARVIVLTGAGRGFSSGADHKSAGSVPHIDGLTRPTFALRSMEVLDDVILALRSQGYTGKIIAFSRNGLLPQPHAMPSGIFSFDKEKLLQKNTLASLLYFIRQAIRSSGCCSVISACHSRWTPAISATQ